MPSPPRSTVLVSAIVAVSFGCGILASQLGLVSFLANLASQVQEAPPAKPQKPTQGKRVPLQPGFWHLSTLRQSSGQQPLPSLSELAKIPYMRGFKDATELPTITVHEPELAYDGLTKWPSSSWCDVQLKSYICDPMLCAVHPLESTIDRQDKLSGTRRETTSSTTK